MPTKKELKQRWTEPDSQQLAERLFDAIERKGTREELAEILLGLPGSDEVASGLDFRGLEFRYAMGIADLDLRGARLDGAKLIGGIVNCRLVEAVLDGFEAANATMKADFTGASFVRARLNGCYFVGSILREADFARAKLERAALDGCDCTDARFNDADLRFASLKDARFEGANLSGANLTQAWLTAFTFDERTLVDGADLAGAQMDDDFARFAGSGGARAGKPVTSYELATLDATRSVLAERNADGHLTAVINRMEQLREEVIADAEFDWSGTLAREFPDDIVGEVIEAFGDADPASAL
jgi:uncharacterized protein YjbI with pentapeptide repeats